jgi:hypothetical protein
MSNSVSKEVAWAMLPYATMAEWLRGYACNMEEYSGGNCDKLRKAADLLERHYKEVMEPTEDSNG